LKLKKEGSWTTKMGIAEKLVDDFYAESIKVFGIEDSTLIDDYISMVRDYGKSAPKIDNIWVKNGGMRPDFIYELNRAGWTPTEGLVNNIEGIIHSYLTSGVRAKSGMTAKINEALKIKDKWVKDLTDSGSKSGNLVNKTVDEWVNSIRGRPDAEGQATSGTKRLLDRSASYASDWFAFAFLGGRPVMAAADAATTFIMSFSKYSSKLTVKMVETVKRGDFNERIRKLESDGEMVQVTASAVLSRAEGETTLLSKAADIGIKASLQDRAYRYSYGSTYLATKELAESAINNSKGSKARIIQDLGDVLEGNNPAEIKYFLELIDNNQHSSAVRFLASINARVVANEYGKVNNPLKWQNSVGRLAGQFGSWGANASVSLIEMYAGKSWQYSARASARLAVSNGAVIGAAAALGVSPSRFIVTPLTVIPGIGPTGTSLEEARQILNTIGGNENERAYAEARLKRLLKSQIPLALKNAAKSHAFYVEQDEKWKAFMQFNGFKVNPD